VTTLWVLPVEYGFGFWEVPATGDDFTGIPIPVQYRFGFWEVPATGDDFTGITR
jgi:hypothetical protein